MDKNDVILHGASAEQQCARCKEYEVDQGAYEILVLVSTFIGPIIGILIGLFAAKKLIGK